MTTATDTYQTSDFQEIVYLLCNDCHLVGSERIGPKRVSLIFAGKANSAGLISNMMFGDSVSLSRALHEIRKARQIIHHTE